MPIGLSDQSARLSERYPGLNYDPQTGISKLDTDVLFNSGEVVLKARTERMLGEFADILQSPEAAHLKIMVVGHTDSKGIKGREIRSRYPNNWHLSAGRALAVADYLAKAGIPEDRMGVAGFGQHQPIASNEDPGSRREHHVAVHGRILRHRLRRQRCHQRCGKA